MESTCGEFYATVESQGYSLPVLGAKPTVWGTTEGYLVSEPGQTFTINLDAKHYLQRTDPQSAWPDVRVKLFIDGVRIDFKTIRGPSPYYGDIPRTIARFTGVRSGEDELRPFIFSLPNLTETDNLKDETKAYGTFRIEIYKAFVEQRTTAINYPRREDIVLSGELSEQQKKGDLSAVTRLGPPIRMRAGRNQGPGNKITYEDGNSPHRTLIIKYGTREMLQTLGVVPRPAGSRQEDSHYRDEKNYSEDRLRRKREDVLASEARSSARAQALAPGYTTAEIDRQIMKNEYAKLKSALEEKKALDGGLVDLTCDD